MKSLAIPRATMGNAIVEDEVEVEVEEEIVAGMSVPTELAGADPLHLSQLPVAPDDVTGGERIRRVSSSGVVCATSHKSVESAFPSGAVDAHGQPIDLRATNSWLLKLGQVSTAEAAEVPLDPLNPLGPLSPLTWLSPLSPLGPLSWLGEGRRL